MNTISGIDRDLFPLCFGGNVFSWTADRGESFAVLDAFVAAGGNFVDTADTYGAWVPGQSGGESEEILGAWMAERGNRDEVVVATKVGGRGAGLAPATIRSHAEASLRRLRTDRIDLYYAHFDDPETPQEETLAAFDALVREGKVRALAASNHSPERLARALEISDREGLARYAALQPHYNLVERDEYEGPLAELAAREELPVLPYFSLAKGFLTGKYRPGSAAPDSARAEGAQAYLDDRGIAVLEALDGVAAAHATSVAAVALAWLRLQPTVLAPIASARTPQQLAELLPSATLELSADELAQLGAASAPAAA
ncbi:MAG TPA: aldo/keto reductase [Conexibacter sp.]|nr:aldo/keto reductase [Conexibacter sp.]